MPHLKGDLMNFSVWARRALLPLLFALPLAAGDPTWTLQPGTELVLTPSGGSASIVLVQNQLTVNSDTILTVTPDPSGQSTSHQWMLPAGTVITLNLSQGLTLRRLDLRRSVEFEIIAQPSTSTDSLAPMTITESPSTLTLNPDPGTGNLVPPSGTGH